MGFRDMLFVAATLVGPALLGPALTAQAQNALPTPPSAQLGTSADVAPSLSFPTQTGQPNLPGQPSLLPPGTASSATPSTSVPSATSGQTLDPNYTYHNGTWWYRQPSGQMLYWANNQWNTYLPSPGLTGRPANSSAPTTFAPSTTYAPPTYSAPAAAPGYGVPAYGPPAYASPGYATPTYVAPPVAYPAPPPVVGGVYFGRHGPRVGVGLGYPYPYPYYPYGYYGRPTIGIGVF